MRVRDSFSRIRGTPVAENVREAGKNTAVGKSA